MSAGDRGLVSGAPLYTTTWQSYRQGHGQRRFTVRRLREGLDQLGSVDLWMAIAASAIAILMLVAASEAQAQTFTILHTFSGPDGDNPEAGLTMDQAGNLYGTAYGGGNYSGVCQGVGCGVVFKMTRHGSEWILNPLYKFSGQDGSNPAARVLFGPDGNLYGTTLSGGASNFGVVFRLQPPPTACKAVLCPWTETVLHSFTGAPDGANPAYGDLNFDQADNVYGTAESGGNTAGYCQDSGGCGVVFELSRSGGQWTENILHTFQWSDGAYPYGGVIFDSSGNIYGTASSGGSSGYGVAYELTPSGSGWTETVLHNFDAIGSVEGGIVYGGLIADSSGNLYGTTSEGGLYGGGSAYELSPSDGGWALSVLYGFDAYQGSLAKLAMDSAGNLYGTIFIGAPEVFRLTPSDGQWALTGFNGSAGDYPYGNMILDSAGNLYGTADVVFEITP